MKKTIKKLVALVLVVAFVFSLAGCAKINYVTNQTIGAIKETREEGWSPDGASEDGLAASDEDEIVIDELTAGTYGGVEFNTLEDVANYYCEAYEYTKSLTAQYTTEDGSTATFYKLVGEEALSIVEGSVLIEGKENSVINGLVPGIVNGLVSKNVWGLAPCSNRDPNLDTDEANGLDFKNCYLVADDILAANVTEQDGKIVMEIQPKAAQMSQKGMDSQGHMFMVLGDIGATVDSISVLTWASGTTEENCLVTYKGGTVKVVIDPATKEIVEADYEMNVTVNVQHANVAVIKDKSASLQIQHTLHYPASDAYILESKGLVRQ